MASVALPTHSAVYEKMQRTNRRWTRPVLLAVPGFRTRLFRIWVPDFSRLQRYWAPRLARRRAPWLISFTCLAMLITIILVSRRRPAQHSWEPPSTDSNEQPTLVFRREDLKRIWTWEIASGHHPSRRSSMSYNSSTMVSGLICAHSSC